MRKIHLGCGGMKLDGWENYDLEVDLRHPLPFKSEAARFIFAEHVVEHITHAEAWRFFQECLRVLQPGGIVRIAIPDVSRIWMTNSVPYREAVRQSGKGDGSLNSCIRSAILDHGHQAAWTSEMLVVVLLASGFHPVRPCGLHQSTVPELVGIEQHGKTVGDAVARAETSVVEGVRP